MSSGSSTDSPVHRLEIVVAMALRAGVSASLALVLFGTVLTFFHHPDYEIESGALDRLVSPGAAFPHDVAAVLHGVRAWRGQAFVMVGLLLLIATPVVRVGTSIVAFALERDWRYVAITTTVFLLLMISFAVGGAE